jgi:hypothetical protein
VPQKLLISLECDSGIGFAWSCHGGLQQVTQEESRGRTSQPRGRPSTLPLYAPQVTQWLREDPDLSGAEILRRVRLAGYRGGKSALQGSDRTDARILFYVHPSEPEQPRPAVSGRNRGSAITSALRGRSKSWLDAFATSSSRPSATSLPSERLEHSAAMRIVNIIGVSEKG